MRRARVEQAILHLISSLAAARCLSGQSALPIGHEFQVSSYTAFDQQRPAVSKNPAGDFIVAWYGFGAGGDSSGDIALRRYDAGGVPQSSELVVAAFSLNSERTPSVASDSSGNFVVVWMSNDRDGSLEGVFARRFNAAGAAQGIEFQVNSYTDGAQVDPSVAVDADGDSVIVWSGEDGSASGVFARRLDSSGNALATEFQVNGFTDDYQFGAAVAMRADGAFVVTWTSRGQDGSTEGIFARRFDAVGVPLATEFQANTYTLSSQNFPAVAAQGDGDFVIAWASFAQDGDGLGVFARPFDASGVPQASELQMNVFTVGHQRLPAIATDELGLFVVAWQGQQQDGSGYGVFARRVSPSAVGLDPEFQVATYTMGNQSYTSVDIDGEGDFVIAWDSTDQDGDAHGVFARRFITLAVLDVDADQKVGPLTDGLLILRFLFGFTGTTLTTGALGVDCTRCAPGAITSYLAALGTVLDVDDNGTPGPLTDGLLILRYLFDFNGATLVVGATGGDCNRCTADTLELHIKLLTI